MPVHAEKDDAEAKIWLRPEVRISESSGFSRRELWELERIVEERRGEIERAWNEHFG